MMIENSHNIIALGSLFDATLDEAWLRKDEAA
jgi:hypothetical protein